MKREFASDPQAGSALTSALTALVLLSVQFILGMYVNLFVSIPSSRPQGFPQGMMMGAGAAWMMGAMSQPVLLAHMLLGFLIVFAALVNLIFAAVRLSWLLMAACGAISVLAAGLGGMAFLMSAGSNLASMAMALGFLVAFGAFSAEALTIVAPG